MMDTKRAPAREKQTEPQDRPVAPQIWEPSGDQPSKEVGGPKGPEPTRFGDWEKAGRCIDF